MKKDVSLFIKSDQYVETLKPSGQAYRRELELEDSVEIMTEGQIFQRANATYITYNESAEAGLEDSRAILKVKDGAVQIKRYGKDEELTMDMQLEEGLTSITRYHIPQLTSIDLEVYTHKVAIDLDEEGYGRINIDYRIKFDEAYSRRTKLDVEVRA